MRSIPTAALVAISFFFLTGCQVVSSRQPNQWQLTQTLLPDLSDDSTLGMQFGTDGKHVFITGSKTVALLSLESQNTPTLFKTSGSRLRLHKLLDTGALAFDNKPTPELLLPDLSRQSLPPETLDISGDGNFVFTAGRGPDGTDAIREARTGRIICGFSTRHSLRQFSFSDQYATVGTRGGIALCDLKREKLMWLTDHDQSDRARGYWIQTVAGY